jgi:hypothetical protein
MITIEQFQTQFDKLQAAFGVTKSGKIAEQWFMEFEEFEFKPFVDACRRLQYSERFPTWDMMKQAYRNAVGQKSTEPHKGCDECENGTVLFRDYRKAHPDFDRRVLSDCAANCICSKNRVPYMFNLDRRKLSLDDQGTYWTARALEYVRGGGE